IQGTRSTSSRGFRRSPARRRRPRSSGTSAFRVGARARAAAAGAAAATVWALQEPLDQRLMRCDYSDVAVLGKALTRGRWWWPAGLALHAVNGAVFGVVFELARRRVAVDARKLALALALGEHLTLYPLCYFI